MKAMGKCETMRRERGGAGVGERREHEVELSVNARSVFLAWVSAVEAARAREAPGVFEEPDVWGCGPFELASLRSETRARLESERLGAGLDAGGRGQEGAGAGIRGRL